MGLREASVLAATAGIMILLANVVEGALALLLWQRIQEGVEILALAFVPVEYANLVPWAVALVTLVSSLGGFIVLAGAVAYDRSHRILGNLLLKLGGGTGVGGLLLLLILGWYGADADKVWRWLAGPAGLGILFLVLAQLESRRAWWEENAPTRLQPWNAPQPSQGAARHAVPVAPVARARAEVLRRTGRAPPRPREEALLRGDRNGDPAKTSRPPR